MDLRVTFQFKGIKLQERLFSNQICFGIWKNHFMHPLIEKAMKGMITGGIARHEFDRFTADRVDEKPKRPKVLAFIDLSFGFYIWLGACGISTCMFFCEVLWILSKKMWHLMRQMIGVILLLIILGHQRRHRH